MVYFLGDWGMGDSDCASYHQHVPNTIQQQFHHQQQHHHHHHQQHQHEQQLQQQQQQQHHNHHQQQQQHVGQIAPNLNQLSPIQFGSTTGSAATYLSHSVDTQHPTTTTSVSSTPLTTTPTAQNVATSSLVTANLQQLSVSSNNLSHCVVDTPLKGLAKVTNDLNNQQIQQQPQQQSHPLASAAAALHQYLGHQRQRSESCANFTTTSGKTKNADVAAAAITNNISSTITGKNNCNLNIKNHLGAITSSHQQLQSQLSKDHLESEDEVALQPLSNQVGGHTIRLLLLNQSTVIKPLNLRELDFYQNIPQDIQKFVPKYKAIKNEIQATNQWVAVKLEKRVFPQFSLRNPTSERSKRKEMIFLRTIIKKISNKSCPYSQFPLMLENITSQFRNPCILDLKMGTRSMGDDASLEFHFRPLLGVTFVWPCKRIKAHLDQCMPNVINTGGRELNEMGLKQAFTMILYMVIVYEHVVYCNSSFIEKLSIIDFILCKLKRENVLNDIPWHPMDFECMGPPATPTKNTKKSATFDYHPDYSIDDDRDHGCYDADASNDQIQADMISEPALDTDKCNSNQISAVDSHYTTVLFHRKKFKDNKQHVAVTPVVAKRAQQRRQASSDYDSSIISQRSNVENVTNHNKMHLKQQLLRQLITQHHRLHRPLNRKGIAKKSTTNATALSSSTPVSIISSPTKTPTIPATTAVNMSTQQPQQPTTAQAQIKQNIDNSGIHMDTSSINLTAAATRTTNTTTTTSVKATATPLNRATTELQQQHQQQQEIKEISKSKKFLQHASKSLDIDTKIQLCDDMHCLVDVRLIDFAHTAFVPRNGSGLFPSPPTTIHHGPDNGFLTGLDSLNRLLNEILSEEIMC
ncbi:Inositol hexakisphosphate kinase 2 [Lucilia cuprina]|nr:Inositol hexakisphosphate kinase 2 [Lucilia cuprina]